MNASNMLRGWRKALWACLLSMLVPGWLAAQVPAPPTPVPAGGAVEMAPALPPAPPPVIATPVAPAPPPAPAVGPLQQRRQQRIQRRQERRHHVFEEVKSLFGMGS